MSAIDVSVDGKAMSPSEVQFLKAFAAIDVSPSGKEGAASDGQPSKAPAAMARTVGGSVTETRLADP